ncbi:MAG: orotate phosphoribosyltransferase [Clostridiaceae bacterium]|nr:orotate phosphoribosyltransferase [Clostridiaceae bacterium]
MISEKRVVEILEKTGVLQRGHFLLTSGRHSNQYMQCARILEYPNYTGEIIEGLAEEFVDQQVDIVVGPATGGIIVAYEMARQLKTRNIFAERVEGKMALRRGFTIPKGAKVVVAEDVITTGGSVQEVIDLILEAEAEVVGVAVLVDRSNGKVDFKTKLVAALSTEVISYEADHCPLCKENTIPLVKPGSRNLKK